MDAVVELRVSEPEPGPGAVVVVVVVVVVIVVVLEPLQFGQNVALARPRNELKWRQSNFRKCPYARISKISSLFFIQGGSTFDLFSFSDLWPKL